MARKTRIFPKSNQDMKRLKIVTLHKSKVSRDLILRQVKVHKDTYYRTINKMKRKRTWLRKLGSGGNFALQKRG